MQDDATVDESPPSSSTPSRRSGDRKTRTKRCAFLGSKAFGLRMLQAVESVRDCEWTVVHPDDGDDRRSAKAAFAEYARYRNLDLDFAASRAAAKAVLSDLRPD